MTFVVIKPAPMELGLNREHYEALVEALAADGFEVRLEIPEERRGAAHASIDTVIEVMASGVVGAAAQTIFDRVADIVAFKLASKKRGSRIVPLYGPDGRVERQVKIPDPPE